MLTVMSSRHVNDNETTRLIFDDPVGYLANFGIEAQVMIQSVMQTAA